MSVARGGRLPTAVDQAMQKLNTSVQIDSVLWREDIRGSIAHARGLVRASVLTKEEGESIVSGLNQVAELIERNELVWDPDKEDVHMNIEAKLAELIGPLGGKLHTARSRNDQVATDLRLWVRRQVDDAIVAVRVLAGAILGQAERELDTLMPSYTHLQRAQPSRLSHHLMAWQELLLRDRDRLRNARQRLNECPLGAGAVAGTGFPLDRQGVAAELEFERPMRNSIDATASRDFLMEVVSGLAILMVHLSRIAEEIVIWSTREFGFIELSDGFSTSSSMMPQKKNPDVAELVRGKAALVVGHVTSLLVLEKSLCFGYGRDLQEDKRPTFEAFDAALTSLYALAGAIETATFRRDRLQQALSDGNLCATDLADLLVQKGVPFREAHHVVGSLVREAEVRNCQLSELPESILTSAHPKLSVKEVRAALDPAEAVERRNVIGGPARVRVEEAIAAARQLWEDN
ncbi:MAG TPA: argininosuccinate lyase [Polyangiaceae bacterium]|nr:argininosuccinate lyase [Polyangiaceae bacterium]